MISDQVSVVLLRGIASVLGRRLRFRVASFVFRRRVYGSRVVGLPEWSKYLITHTQPQSPNVGTA